LLAEQAVGAQRKRLHIAWELHDVVAHTVAGMNVQAAWRRRCSTVIG
jgi:signal transduction histidine kinase